MASLKKLVFGVPFVAFCVAVLVANAAQAADIPLTINGPSEIPNNGSATYSAALVGVGDVSAFANWNVTSGQQYCYLDNSHTLYNTNRDMVAHMATIRASQTLGGNNYIGEKAVLLHGCGPFGAVSTGLMLFGLLGLRFAGKRY
jgi:hypothetical protein